MGRMLPQLYGIFVSCVLKAECVVGGVCKGPIDLGFALHGNFQSLAHFFNSDRLRTCWETAQSQCSGSRSDCLNDCLRRSQ